MATDNEALTTEEISLVRENWRQIYSDWKKHGVTYFIRLFNEYPGTQQFFKSVANLNNDELQTSARLRAHVVNFGGAFESFIANLDDPEVLVDLIQKVAANHHRRKINADLFQKALDLFLVVAGELTELDSATAVAWKKTANTVVSVIRDHQKTLE